jgi:hypothetical protein
VPRSSIAADLKAASRPRQSQGLFDQQATNMWVFARSMSGAIQQEATMYLKYREMLDIFMPDTEDNKNEVFRSDAERFFRACIELFRFEDNLASAQVSALPNSY